MKRIYVFEMEDELLDHRWDELIKVVGEASSFLYAIWAYMIDSDSYYLSEIAEIHLSGDYGSAMWFVMSEWADDAFCLWEDRIERFRLEHFGELTSVFYDRRAQSYAIVFGADNGDN